MRFVAMICLAALMFTIPSKVSSSSFNLQNAENSTVIVNIMINKAGANVAYGLCTGTEIMHKKTTEVILTAGHCLEDLIENGELIEHIPTSVQYFDGDVGKIITYKASENDDMGIIIVHTMRIHPSVNVNFNHVLHRQEQVFVFGHTEGLFWSYSRGFSTQGNTLNSTNDEPNVYFIDCSSCGPGDSGGGVYDKNGNYIGMLVSSMGESNTAFIPVSFLREDFNSLIQ
jgi:hypothetical protein